MNYQTKTEYIEAFELQTPAVVNGIQGQVGDYLVTSPVWTIIGKDEFEQHYQPVAGEKKAKKKASAKPKAAVQE